MGKLKNVPRISRDLPNNNNNGPQSTQSHTIEPSDVIPMCDRLKRFYASKACRSAVMIGDGLTKNKMKDIVSKMGSLDQPWNCPHGRPTMRILTSIIEQRNAVLEDKGVEE